MYYIILYQSELIFFSAAMTNIVTALNAPENAQKITEAKEKSGNDVLKMMQIVFPIVMQIQMDVIKNYGYPEGREGTQRKDTRVCSKIYNKKI
jgi:hypothetical protein